MGGISSKELMCSPLGRYDMTLDGILNQTRGALKPQILHHLVFMEGDRPRADMQDVSGLFHGFPFS